jgi:hypothetical protein
MRLIARIGAMLLAVVGVGAAVLAMAAPSHDRTWRSGQERLPEIAIGLGIVQIRNVRDFSYESENQFTPSFRDASYDLDSIEKVWFVLSPFGRDWRGPAHIFLTFGFSDGRYLSISAEARREVDEEYSILGGALRRYELMYVIGEERDLIGLRAVTWDDPCTSIPSVRPRHR